MRRRAFFCGLILTVSVALASTANAQQSQTSSAIPADMYCSGVISTDAVPRDSYLITGEQSNYKTSFQEGDYVYINKGASQGVKVGDKFSVVRAVKRYNDVSWYKWQSSLLRAMGTLWEDEGRLKVVVAQPDVSIAQVEESCNYMLRGDILLPFAERQPPTLKSENDFDRFAPPSGKGKAMVVTGKQYQNQLGMHDIAYINLGSAQGVQVGGYFRIFRYQGTQDEKAYQLRGIATHIYGFGSAPSSWKWDKLPREVLGEGIVLRTGPNSSTVLITFSQREILAGDYVEVE